MKSSRDARTEVHAAATSPNGFAAFAALGAIIVALHGLHAGLGVGGERLDTAIDDWLFLGVIAGAGFACGVRARSPTPERTAWLLATACFGLWLAAQVVFRLVVTEETGELPPAALVMLLGAYLIGAVAIVMLARARLRRFDPGLAYDGLVSGLALSALAVAVIVPVEGFPNGDQLSVFVLYMVADLVLLTFVVVTLSLTGWRPDPSWLAVGAGLLVNAVANVALVEQAQAGTASRGSLLDTLFAASAVLLGIAALVPARRWPDVRARGLPVLVAPIVAGVVAVGVLTAASLTEVYDLAALLAAAALLALIARTGFAFVEDARLLATTRQEALTDALTGLGNRRMLMNDLEAAIARGSAAEPRTLVVFDLDGFEHYSDTFGHPAGDELLARMAGRLAGALPAGTAYRVGGDEFCVLIDGAWSDAEPLISAAATALSEPGDAWEVTNAHGAVVLPTEASTAADALQAADRRMYVDKARRISPGERQAESALLQLLAEREPELGAHLLGVGSLVARVAQRMGLEGEQRDETTRAAELHDIGKLAVPDAILHKPGPLDDEEQRFIRQHPVVGERVLRAVPALAPVAKIVRASHERYDGSGYPDALAGDAIPLGARIVAACDAFIAMVSPRAQRPGMSVDDALAALDEGRGAQFDPDVVDAVGAEVRGALDADAPAGASASSSEEAEVS